MCRRRLGQHGTRIGGLHPVVKTGKMRFYLLYIEMAFDQIFTIPIILAIVRKAPPTASVIVFTIPTPSIFRAPLS